MRYLKADKIFDGRAYLAEDLVLVLDDQNLLKEMVSQSLIANDKIEFLKGIITPGFVNAHCHLELSHLHNRIDQHTGLPAFARAVLSQRNLFHDEEVKDRMAAEDKTMWESGIVAVGDICNWEGSFETKSGSNIHYHSFIELIGLHPQNADIVFKKGTDLYTVLKGYGLNGSLAAHAPYSVSAKLLELILNFDKLKSLPFSMHSQESQEEIDFLMGGKSAFYDLYEYLKIDLAWFKAPGISSTKTLAGLLQDQPALLVHNTLSNSEDVKLLHDKMVSWCFCPGANLYIENRLPDFSVFEGSKDSICIGTDSLASNASLDLTKEMNLVLSATDIFTPEDLLQAASFNGARVLGISDSFGTLIAGKNSGLNLVSIENSQIHFKEKIA